MYENLKFNSSNYNGYSNYLYKKLRRSTIDSVVYLDNFN